MNKKSLLSVLLVLMLVFSSFGVYAHEHMEDESNTIVDIAAANEDFSTLVAALTEADLVETLQGEGPFTVFAPTDEAFGDLLEALEIEAADLLAHPQLADVLLYHVVEGKVMSTDLEDGMEATTVGGETVTISLEDGVFVNESEVIEADIEADNGVIHVINAVLVPESFELEVEASNTIVDIAVANEDFSTLVAALQTAELVETLQGEGPFTVFAPTDQAFGDLLEALEIQAADLLAHPQLADVLLYHVVEGKVMSTDLEDGMEATTVGGETVTISLEDGVFVNESQVIEADIEADNGVIHVINAVLVPESFELDVEEEEIIAEPTTTTIVLVIGEKEAMVNGVPMMLDVAPYIAEGDRTMVPIRFVTEALGFEVEWDGDARKVTILHGEVIAVEMTIGSQDAEVFGQPVELDVAPMIYTPGDRTVVPLRFVSENLGFDVDWDADTKTITISTDKEMEEASNTIVDIAAANENFSTLVAALIEADLVETLQGEGPFTVFAPTDEAFAALLEALEIEAADLLAHPQLGEVLLYHVVSGAVESGDLVDGSQVATALGETVTFDLEDGVFVNESEVIDADIIADNGVIHVIDTVLVPESFVLDAEATE